MSRSASDSYGSMFASATADAAGVDMSPSDGGGRRKKKPSTHGELSCGRADVRDLTAGRRAFAKTEGKCRRFDGRRTFAAETNTTIDHKALGDDAQRPTSYVIHGPFADELRRDLGGNTAKVVVGHDRSS